MKHLFKAKLNWASNKNPLDLTKKLYIKSHQIQIEGKPILDISEAAVNGLITQVNGKLNFK